MNNNINKYLSHITFNRYRFTLEFFSKPFLPPYHGSLLRGAFGHSLKKTVCISTSKDCSDCILKDKCLYIYLFETNTPKNSLFLNKYTHIPHPFIIEPEGLENNNLYFNLVLIGNSNNYLSYIIYSIIEMGKKFGLGKYRHKFVLKQVDIIDSNNNFNLIYSVDSPNVSDNFPNLSINDFKYKSKKQIKLEFITPLRVKVDGKYASAKVFDSFDVFFKILLRRLSSISYFYFNKELELNFNQLLTKAKDIKTISNNLYWKDIKRYSNRKKTSMLLGGLKGSIEFKGNSLSNFYPFILLGQYLHLGKETSFGLGRYKIL